MLNMSFWLEKKKKKNMGEWKHAVKWRNEDGGLTPNNTKCDYHFRFLVQI